jgi:hypothetical protein
MLDTSFSNSIEANVLNQNSYFHITKWSWFLFMYSAIYY